MVSRHGRLSGTVALPVVQPGVGDDALHRGGHVVDDAGIEPPVAGRRRRRRARTGRAGAWWRRSAGPRAAPTVRVPRSRRAVRRDDPGHEHVPVLAGPVDRRVEGDDPDRCEVFRRVEEQDVDARGVLRVDAEVDARRRHRGTERMRDARLDDARDARSRDRRRADRRIGRSVAVVIGSRARRWPASSRRRPCRSPPCRTRLRPTQGTRRGWRSPPARRRGRAGWRSRAWPSPPGRTA